MVRAREQHVVGVHDPPLRLDHVEARRVHGLESRGEASAQARRGHLVATLDGELAVAGDLGGKILVYCINPYDFAGGLRRLIDADTSTATLLQARTAAKVVQTLNQVGAAVMAKPSAYAVKPLQFVAADDAAATATVMALLQSMGYDARDAGGLDHAADLEAMARVWIAQAFAHGMAPDTSWALVRPG